MTNIKGNINGIKSNIIDRIKSKIFISMILVLSLFVELSPVSAFASMVPATPGGGALVPVPYGDWMMPVTETGSGASIEISVDQPDSDVYWQEVVDGKWRFRNTIKSWFDSDICHLSPNTNGHHYFVAQHTQVNGVTGNFYICEYCGKSAGEVLEDSYDDYVSDLPATGIDSQGGLIWEPTIVDIYSSDPLSFSLYIFDSYPATIYSLPYSKVVGSDTRTVSYSSRSFTVSCVNSNNQNYSSGYFGFSNIFFRAPISGSYYRLETPLVSCDILTASGNSYHVSESYSSKVNFINSGDQVSIYGSYDGYIILGTYSGFRKEGIIYFPVFRIIPSSGSINTTTDTTYNIDSRPTSIQGDLAYYNVQGELQLAPDVSIVNEGDSSYYNPVTDTTYDISDWSYDYSDRSYKLTLDSGDEVEVTFGDANITINEGDTSYTLHYVIEQSPSDSATCEHNYVDSITTQPTCTIPGVRTYTCTICGDSYSESIPALGHDYHDSVTREPTCTVSGVLSHTCSVDGFSYNESIPALGHNWVIKSQVQTEYDTDGSLLQQGYVIYRCTNCGEEYKTLDTVYPSPPPTPTPPPSPTSTPSVPIDSDDPGFISWILALAKWVFGSFDGDALKEWFNWFDSDTSDLDYDFWSG